MPDYSKDLSLRYPPPYEVIDGCLYRKITEKKSHLLP